MWSQGWRATSRSAASTDVKFSPLTTIRNTYLRLLRDNSAGARVTILGYCLMTNHVHLIAVPAKEDSLSVWLRRAHGRYAQYYNAQAGRSGHL